MRATSLFSWTTYRWRLQAHTFLLREWAYRARFMAKSLGAQVNPRFLRLRNCLPNRGPAPVSRDYGSAGEVIGSNSDPWNRSQGIPEFEGLALDDAVFDPEWELDELYSNLRLAAFLARFAHAHYRHPAVLELGCGPAHLFYFLRRAGIPNYVGIDGNPYFVALNPFLQGFERHFLHLNLQEEIRLVDGPEPVLFDLICSFEVLEHIKEERLDNFLRTVRNHMHSRSVFFCTASLKGGFDVHLLVRNRDWWLRRFAQVGLYPRPDERQLVREMDRRHPWNWSLEMSNVFALELRD